MNCRMSGIFVSPSVFHIVMSSRWRRARDSNPHGVAALPGFGPGALPIGLALQRSWGRGRDSNSRGQWPRRVSGALDSLLVLSSPWLPCRGSNPIRTLIRHLLGPLSYTADGALARTRTATTRVETSHDLLFTTSAMSSPLLESNQHLRDRSTTVCPLT